MKYHKHELIKQYDNDVEGGYYYLIYKDNKLITTALTLSNAKEFIDTYNDKTGYNYNVLC